MTVIYGCISKLSSQHISSGRNCNLFTLKMNILIITWSSKGKKSIISGLQIRVRILHNFFFLLAKTHILLHVTELEHTWHRSLKFTSLHVAPSRL